MTVLRSLETKIAGLVEGTFSRAFRSEVRPVEIARKLAREMEEHKSLSVSRTYVPNEYRVYLSRRDRERFAGHVGNVMGAPSPMHQRPDDEAHDLTEAFIKKYGGKELGKATGAKSKAAVK